MVVFEVYPHIYVYGFRLQNVWDRHVCFYNPTSINNETNRSIVTKVINIFEKIQRCSVQYIKKHLFSYILNLKVNISCDIKSMLAPTIKVKVHCRNLTVV